jgi:hypothetical protein
LSTMTKPFDIMDYFGYLFENHDQIDKLTLTWNQGRHLKNVPKKKCLELGLIQENLVPPTSTAA